MATLKNFVNIEECPTNPEGGYSYCVIKSGLRIDGDKIEYVSSLHDLPKIMHRLPEMVGYAGLLKHTGHYFDDTHVILLKFKGKAAIVQMNVELVNELYMEYSDVSKFPTVHKWIEHEEELLFDHELNDGEVWEFDKIPDAKYKELVSATIISFLDYWADALLAYGHNYEVRV